MWPLTRITAVPWSLRAEHAETADEALTAVRSLASRPEVAGSAIDLLEEYYRGANDLEQVVALGQDATDDAADVILVIEEQWEAEQKSDKDWLSDMLHPKFSGWQKQAPAPRSKKSTKLWDRFSDTQGKMLEHELYFQNIVVEGDVAVAHYLYTSASEDKDDNVEISNGRYTDVLIRTDDGWKFIAWHGGDDDQN